jgi:CheY-like chemotaxis protein
MTILGFATCCKEMTGILVDHPIDLVILDLRLAGGDGMVLAQRLRDDADRIMGLELGAAGHQAKRRPRLPLCLLRTQHTNEAAGKKTAGTSN